MLEECVIIIGKFCPCECENDDDDDDEITKIIESECSPLKVKRQPLK